MVCSPSIKTGCVDGWKTRRCSVVCARRGRVSILLLSGEIDTTTADGMFRMHILGAASEFESAKKSERDNWNAISPRRSGKFSGGPRRYGYDAKSPTKIVDDREVKLPLRIRNDEARIIREIAKRLLDGQSIRSITLDLNERKISTVKGGPWLTSQLREMILPAPGRSTRTSRRSRRRCHVAPDPRPRDARTPTRSAHFRSPAVARVARP